LAIDKKKRPRRIAADEAHAWARNLRLNNSQAKLVLSMATLYVDGDGYCFVSVPSLADDTELSAQTVRRRLAWLEEIGAIARLPQWIDEKGTRNGDGRGKRSSDLIRLLLDADTDDIEARAAGLHDGETAAIAPIHGEGANEAENSLSPTAALPQPYHSGQGLTSEPEPESPPQPPSGGSVDLEGWKEFQEDWQEPILRQSIAQHEWQALNADQRTQARQAARGYVAWRKAQRRPPNVLGAHLFLREREAWPGFAAYAPDAKPAGITGFELDSVEGRAILAIYAVAKTRPFEGRNGLVYAGEITPQVLKFADAGPPSSWPFIEDRQQIAAWANFLSEHVRGNRPQFVVTRGIGDAQRRGIEAPWDWPPRIDGKLSPTGSLDALMSEQDLQEDFK
jgi:hypothetical protein